MNIETPQKDIKEWRPFTRQQTFLEIPDSIKEALYGGAAGGGKTELLLAIPLVRQFHESNAFHGVFFRRTFPELEASLIPRSAGLMGSKINYKDFGGQYNATSKSWSFPSGAQIRFKFMEQDSDTIAHDTIQYNYIGWEELTTMTRYQYIYMISRNRQSSKNDNLPAFMRSATNPGGIGHKWVRERFIDPCPEGQKLIKEIIGEREGRTLYSERIYIPSLPTDNPYLSQDYIDSLYNLPEAEKQTKLFGNWYSTAGEVFTEFRSKRYADEPERALHVIKPFKIPEWWPKVIAIDWGWAAMTYILFGAISPEGRLYIYREYATYKTNTAEWANTCKKLSEYDGNIVDVVIDPSATQKRGQQTIFELFVQHSSFDQARLADNDRVSGKALIHEFLRWKETPASYTPGVGYDVEYANRLFRMQGQKALEEYQKRFTPALPETNIPLMQIFDTCPLLIETIPACTPNPDKPEDVLEFSGDDPYDTLRYLVKAAKYYTTGVRSPLDIRQQRIMEHFEKTQDHTYLNLQMDKLEYERKSGMKYVKRFH